jgi:hypothetical protein
MHLPDFLKDPDLNELRARMGTQELGTFRLSINPYRFTIAELEALIDGGIELSGLREVKALSDHTLAYKDRRVLLHRRDLPVTGARPPARQDLPHFHIADCVLVRGARLSVAMPHVVTAREDGQFQVTLVGSAGVSTSFERLPVCLHCLEELGFDGYEKLMPTAERVRVAAGFTVTRFFSTYHRALAADGPGGPPSPGGVTPGG